MILVFLRFVGAYLRATYAKWYGFEVMAPPLAQEFRTKKCFGCDFFQDGECTKCGCMVLAKTMLATEKCPIGKWKRLWIRKRN